MSHTLFSPRQLAAMALITGAASIPVGPAHAAIVFSEDFESASPGNAAPAGWVESVDDALSVEDVDPVSGNQHYKIAVGTSGVTSSARSLVDTSNAIGGSVDTAQDFVISLTVRPETVTPSGSVNFGVLFLTDSAGFDGYYARVLGTGSLRLFEVNGTGDTSALTSESDQGGFSAGTEYLFTITGTYSDSNNDTVNDQLTIDFTITGGNFTGVGVSATDSANIRSNDNVGFRATASGSRNAILDLDDLIIDSPSVVIPEPASLVLLGLGTALIAGRRRCRN